MSGATRCQVKVPAHEKFRAGSFAREEHPSPTAFGRSSHATGVAANTRTNTMAGLVAANHKRRPFRQMRVRWNR